MKTPLKTIILLTVVLSLMAGFLPNIYPILGLSRLGISDFYLWQFLSYTFVERGPISLNFFLVLGFNMYILWIFGSFLIERAHTRLFLALYLGGAFVGGACSLIAPHSLLLGSMNAVYGVMIAWMMLNPGAQLLLFFSLPFKAHWLILGLVGVSLVLDLVASNYAAALSLTGSCLYGYFFALFVWRTPGPLPFLRKFEKRIFQFFEKKQNHEPYQRTKIFDIKSGEPVQDDNQFMDAMLDRISRHGEDSLTEAEKKRMKEISSKKKK